MVTNSDDHNPLSPDELAFIQCVLNFDEAVTAVELVQALRSLESDDQVIRTRLRAMRQFLLEVELMLMNE
jgi:hypothetical protein